ncbi:phage portal protein [Cumulibacter soli]|uniref:phage portal protein n=1 Tax=Cumulibacter soli TaxID=2546344 RepID=UPI001419AEB5|nr:phage portal protein [Cumulibacter soli]
MVLPLDAPANTPWPPLAYQPQIRDLTGLVAAWTSDERDVLTQTPSTPAKARGKWWQRRATDQVDTHRARSFIPAAIAGDVAAVASDLLFGSPAILTAPGSGQQQTRLEELSDRVAAALQAGADIASGTGGAWLVPRWNTTLSDRSTLQAIGQDQAVPEYTLGVLTAVSFVVTLPAKTEADTSTWRHIERHEDGRVWHALREATNPNELGAVRPLADHPSTAALGDIVQQDGGIDLTGFGVKGMLPSYVSNGFWRRYRGGEYGAPDHASSLPDIDSLSQTLSAWDREIRVGQARILVAEGALGPDGALDLDDEVFTELKGLDQGTASSRLPVEQVHFDLRVQDFAATALAQTERIITSCGYAPQTFGLHVEGAISGTSHKLRERRTYRTLGRKQRAWEPAVLRAAQWMLAIDKQLGLPDAGMVDGLNLEWSDDNLGDAAETASTIQALRDARAISIETSVRMAQPDLSPDQVDDEVRRIMDENKTTSPLDLIG